MKKLNFSIIILCFGIWGTCQTISYGIRGGMFYNFQGKLSKVSQDVGKVYDDNGHGNIGWQIGGFARIRLPLTYLQPELVFSHFSHEYKSKEGSTFQSKIFRLDLPLLVGTRIFYLLHLYAGPVFSVNLDGKAILDEVKNYKSDIFNMGLQFCIGVDISKFTLDIRWERGLSKVGILFVQRRTNSNFSMENRPSMLLLSVGYKF
ncbi:MAG: outer membrane beta-barrel protein [Flavobacteriales bacterium AspAUS03]